VGQKKQAIFPKTVRDTTKVTAND